MDLIHAASGFFVGLLVGFTGVGGGSLMAPIMILLLGVAPVTAVGTDLWFASMTKAVGGAVHHGNGSADLTVVKRLCYGSLPAAALTVLVLSQMDRGHVAQGLITTALGIVLLFTAAATVFRRGLQRFGERKRSSMGPGFKRHQAWLTVAAGAVLGTCVSLTSVGAGALGATILVALYPYRLSLRKVVGTDIVHAIPLTLVAGIGHLWLGNVDWWLLLGLLAGSVPGVVIGSMLIHKVDERMVQMALSLVLFLVAVKLLAN